MSSYESPSVKAILNKGYLASGESVDDMIYRVANAFSSNKPMTGRIYGYIKKQWFFPSSPIVTAAKKRIVEEVVYSFTKDVFEKIENMPISCFGNRNEDTIDSIIDKANEWRHLSVGGGGVAGHWSSVRSPSKKAPGAIAFLKPYDADVNAYRQGTTRRGAYAAWMHISHPQIVSFINARRETGGDPNNKVTNLHHGVNIPRAFYKACAEDLMWDLVDPHTKKVTDSIRARQLLELIYITRAETGEPMIHNMDVTNDYFPEQQKALGLSVSGSNLCFAGDTMVTVADCVNAMPIKELAALSKGVNQFQVYTKEEVIKDGQKVMRPVVRLATAFETRSAELIKVTLSDDSSFTCTPDHMLYGPDAVEKFRADESLGKELDTLNIYKNRSSRFIGSYLYEKRDPDTGSTYLVESESGKFIKDYRGPVTVVCIEPAGSDVVYCLNVPGPNKFYIAVNNHGREDWSESTNILVSNCSEIVLANGTGTYEDAKPRTFVCVLLSPNDAKYDEWKDDDLFISDCVEFLDNVVEFYINCAPESHKDAVYSAYRERALGIGQMGFHTYLQSKMIPFSSPLAKSIAINITKNIKEKAVAASLRLGKERGECPDMVGTGRRNSHLLAIAPNATSGQIVDVSPSTEPLFSNIFVQTTDSGDHIKKNQALVDYLESIGYNTQDVWDSIIEHGGSVQHLAFLDDYIKDVFAKAEEIDMNYVVDLALARQPYVCQAQSTNLMFPANISMDYLHSVIWRAKDLKTLYYHRSERSSRGGNIIQVSKRNQDFVTNPSTCMFCEG